MMQKRYEIEREVVKTLELLNAYEKPECSPYLAAKIKANLSDGKTTEKYRLGIILKPALILLLVIFNIFTVFVVSGEFAEKERTSLREITLNEIVDDYGIVQENILK